MRVALVVGAAVGLVIYEYRKKAQADAALTGNAPSGEPGSHESTPADPTGSGQVSGDSGANAGGPTGSGSASSGGGLPTNGSSPAGATSGTTTVGTPAGTTPSNPPPAVPYGCFTTNADGTYCEVKGGYFDGVNPTSQDQCNLNPSWKWMPRMPGVSACVAVLR